MPRVLADLTPLRESREFRVLFAGQLVSYFGTQLTVVAVPIQVYALTRSSLAVGLVGAAELVPLFAGTVLGGALVDSFDRRKLLLVMQLLLALTSVGLALNARLATPQLWPLYALTAVAAALSGIDRPARAATMPRLLAPELLPAGNALWQMLLSVGAVTGPAIGGVLIARTGIATVFWIDVATFAVALGTVVMLPALPPEGGRARAGLASIAEGLRFLKGRRLLAGTFLIDLDAMVFGMPRALFPALGTGLYGGGAQTIGLLYAAVGAGNMLGAVTSGWVGGVRRQGRAVIVAVAVWGLAITAFGATPWLPFGLACLAVAGAADVVSAVFRNVILQVTVPDSLRGRMSAVHIAVVTGGPRLGDVEAGVVAALTSARVSVLSGGLACVAGVLLLAWRIPELLRYDAQRPAG